MRRGTELAKGLVLMELCMLVCARLRLALINNCLICKVYIKTNDCHFYIANILGFVLLKKLEKVKRNKCSQSMFNGVDCVLNVNMPKLSVVELYWHGTMIMKFDRECDVVVGCFGILGEVMAMMGDMEISL